MYMVNPKIYHIGKHHDIIVKRVAKKLKISESEVIRRRIKPFKEMLMELEQDMLNSDIIDLKRM